MKKIRSLLVANRSEIAIRVLRAASEMGIRTVAIYANEDRFALHRFKADESYLVGVGKKPIQAYLDIPDIIRIAKEAGVDAIHPGYGFLSENPDFALACAQAGIAFIGPSSDVMKQLGNKVAARELAERAGVPVVPATIALPHDIDKAQAMAQAVGYPLMLKASWGGGGRGMRVVETAAELPGAIDVARREAQSAFGNDEVYLEKLVRRARHVEVQVMEEVGLPLHFHTHDTSGIAAASVLAAVEAGCDAVDGALDALSGLTSQPNLGSIAAALQGTERDPGMDGAALLSLSQYWEGVRHAYAPFEPEIRSGTSDVYNHAMPGGQYTNLREQARAMGLEHRWPEISRAYADVNQLFGDIVKVTPTSKVVGDMAIFMVANDLTPQEVAHPEKEIAFPESVISLFKGELGFPPEGFPKALEAKVLKGEPPLAGRVGNFLPAVDLEAKRHEAEQAVGRQISDTDLAS